MTNEIHLLPAMESEGADMPEKSGVLLASDASANALSNILTVMPTEPSVGQQLRTAREAKNLSASDVAQALKLSVRQVLFLENDDWSSLPGTIARGFIRNYSRLLNLDSEALMSQLDLLHMPQPPELDVPCGTSAALPQASRIERRDVFVMFLGLILVILALLAYFFIHQDFWQSKLSALNQLTQEPKLVVPETIPADSLPPSTSDQAVAANPEPDPVQQPTPQLSPTPEGVMQSTQAANLPHSGTSSLKFSFARPSWVEIRDHSGQIIFSQLNPAGSEREIEGQPPFALVVGSASGVILHYKGKSIELPQRSKDDVARFKIE